MLRVRDTGVAISRNCQLKVPGEAGGDLFGFAPGQSVGGSRCPHAGQRIRGVQALAPRHDDVPVSIRADGDVLREATRFDGNDLLPVARVFVPASYLDCRALDPGHIDMLAHRIDSNHGTVGTVDEVVLDILRGFPAGDVASLGCAHAVAVSS